MSKTFKIGDEIDIPHGTIVKVKTTPSFTGKIVGKASTDINQYHIVECIDSTYPSKIYPYNTLSVPLSIIEIID